jgi:CRP-like cAMP-binding protein
MARSDAPARLPPPNHLLAALPRREYARLRPHLEAVPLALEAVLHRPGEPIKHVYFPTRGVLSQLVVVEKGGTIEVGMVGREGLAGLPILLGAEATPVCCVVQMAGEALRMKAEVFRDQVGPGSPLHDVALRYTHAFVAQVSQSAACNSLHPAAKRCCRWLLMTHDRAGGDRFPLTHALLAGMLGVRRATVTNVARLLRTAQLIRYRRGEVTVLDRAGLESAACECYRIVQAEFDRLRG